ncbi:MAG: hypothetical protein ACI9HE_001021 [Planctomycetota bacterium]|jgi:uncharacterized protein (DUF58 family)
MPSPSKDSRRLGAALQLALGVRPRGGHAGQTLGRAPGASLEFEDRRGYAPGDDVRHLDWRALARTDQLLVRQYREEVTPVLELLVDDSRSMGADEDKAQLCVDLVSVLVGAAHSAGYGVRLVRLGQRPEPMELARFEADGLAFDGRVPLAETARGAASLLRPGTARLLISDFLSPHEPQGLVRPLGAGAGALGLVQVLSAFDADPPVGQALRLVDSESAEGQDLVLDEATVSAYKSRVERLGEGLAREARRAGGALVSVIAEGTDSLQAACHGDLCRFGILTPAGA